MPEDQIWRPLDAKRNGLDCILWISHSQGNGTTPPGNILGSQADTLVFLMFGGCYWCSVAWAPRCQLPCCVQSGPEPERAAPHPAGLSNVLLEMQEPKSLIMVTRTCFTSKYKLFYARFKKTPSFLLSCKSRENVFFNALPRIVCLVWKITGPSSVAQWLRLCFQCCRHGSIPDQETKIPHAAQHSQK